MADNFGPADKARGPLPADGENGADLADTGFELSADVAFPKTAAVTTRYVAPHPGEPVAAATTSRWGGGLDPETRALFHLRLRLCCLVAAAPFFFFLVCAATNFIEAFGRGTVGWTGLVLCGVTLAGLGGTAGFLFRVKYVDEVTLRVLELAVFGGMALFFAYWQFMVLTATPAEGFEGTHHEQSVVLAAALIVHFNWFALLVFHGVLVPNTPARGAGVAAAMCAAALAISIVAALTHPPTGRNAGPLFAVSTTMLAAGAGLSVFGTAKTAALRREVQSAREAVREMGQYRLRRKLGAGGMGEVYLAEHRLIKRPCALKRIHRKYLNNPEQVRRFEREVQATAQLRHPNTVEIYDYGRADDGTFYYVMEYLPGMSLEDMVARHGPQPPARAVHILRQVCGALRAAHRQGLVHRDVKPSNILVFPHGNPHDQAKVVDFGLVHTLADEVDPDAKITREGLIVGTPEYMSPEQASGGALDGRSDLFGLGSVAYFLLTGREGFHRDNPVKTLMAVVNEEPAPIAKYNPHVPDDLTAVIKRCLAKTPDDRYESAADLEEALAACGCSGQWSGTQAADWWDTHPDAQPGTGTDLESLALQDD
ncbi:serine/threonine protein kinase [Fimbriiglobus ruber]|uniref:non-specific serine/threonine protein kinase n=1 Tax=Fimbriiglobus ruber TaxID=1908690 RepID=A0A225DK99_9BACT|nr:serine/threonine protein kinase [Fimbriiglobus ruber]